MLRELVVYFNIEGEELSKKCSTTPEALVFITALEKLGLKENGRPHQGTVVGCKEENSYGIMACNNASPRRISKMYLEQKLKNQKVIPYGTTI